MATSDSTPNVTSRSISSSPKAVADLPDLAVETIESLYLTKPLAAGKGNGWDEKKDEENVTTTSWARPCPASQKSIRTQNPIRAIVDPIVKSMQSGLEREDGKDHISLALGDPTVGDSLPPCQIALDAVVEAVLTKSHAAGYVNACGLPAARQAIAEYHSSSLQSVTSENVIIASGCSGALELALTSLLDPGTCILVPQPGFPLYQVIAESHGASILPYQLIPERNWEINLEHLESLLLQRKRDVDIRGIVVNNPSNPTGAVFSLEHLEELVALCDKYQLPIIADEVYGDLTFGNHKFFPLAQVAARQHQVPVITTSGLAKQYLLPGWRVGWVVFHDNTHGSLEKVEAGAKRLAQVILGASHLVQSVIPKLLAISPEMELWKRTLRGKLEKQAHFLYQQLSSCHGLTTLAPQGAMYSMVCIDLNILNVQCDIDFCTKLLEEENVFVLPGSAFGCQNIFRVVFCCDEPILEAAANRIAQFCLRHARC
ncbi:tyrosine/nicotianamine aminotransferase [Nitzschia inconspicua]|uniref:Tyrosine/nicotianamine aminotransferase n=1 Tax=Nitzschia inconspicua TaxID=303405 RepID=A0A9K3PJ58_9STRA|nr:tyrosine/nicotianamine aminotransferase [Nitzschia inconspicua]